MAEHSPSNQAWSGSWTPAYPHSPSPTSLTITETTPPGCAWTSAETGTTPMRVLSLVAIACQNATVAMLSPITPGCIHQSVQKSARAQTRLAVQYGTAQNFLLLWVPATLPSLPTAFMLRVYHTSSTTICPWVQSTVSRCAHWVIRKDGGHLEDTSMQPEAGQSANVDRWLRPAFLRSTNQSATTPVVGMVQKRLEGK